MSHTDRNTDRTASDQNRYVAQTYQPEVVPDDGPVRRATRHADDTYQVAGTPADERAPLRPRPHADLLIGVERVETDADEEGWAIFDPLVEDAFFVANDAAFADLGEWR